MTNPGFPYLCLFISLPPCHLCNKVHSLFYNPVQIFPISLSQSLYFLSNHLFPFKNPVQDFPYLYMSLYLSVSLPSLKYSPIPFNYPVHVLPTSASLPYFKRSPFPSPDPVQDSSLTLPRISGLGAVRIENACGKSSVSKYCKCMNGNGYSMQHCST